MMYLTHRFLCSDTLQFLMTFNLSKIATVIIINSSRVTGTSQGSTLSTVRSSETSGLDLRTSAFVQPLFRLNSGIMSLVNSGKWLEVSQHYSLFTLAAGGGFNSLCSTSAPQGIYIPTPPFPLAASAAHYHASTDHRKSPNNTSLSTWPLER